MYLGRTIVYSDIIVIDILIIIAGISILLILTTAYIKYVNKLRKQKRFRNPLVRLDIAADTDIVYRCNCGKGDTIVLGKCFSSWMQKFVLFLLLISIVISITSSTFDTIQKFLTVLLVMLPILLIVYVPIYFQIFKEMLKAGHTGICSKRVAITALPYQMQNSWFKIKK